MKRGRKKKEEVAEDYCFICKDGGLLIVCEHAHCNKAYHPECVSNDSTSIETDKRWICSWHSCFICRKVSKYQCFVCPLSVCRTCMNAAEFVHFKKKKGFCNDCLRLALLVEENVDVDSDGGKVDFKDRDTYEFLFKEYWEIINESERLTLEDLHALDAQLKKGEHDSVVSDSDAIVSVSDIEKGDDIMEFDEFERPEFEMKVPKKLNVFGKEFAGWGSKELINFLTSIGKSTDKPISQIEVHDMILEYIKENKLIHPLKKKKVICDPRLHCLFRRKSVNRLKIFDLLERHFPDEKLQEDKASYETEDDVSSISCKRQRISILHRKTKRFVPIDFGDEYYEVPKKFYASITTKNIKLVYLRRSLIEKFLKDPETFDCKVINCFVRVKCDLNEYPSSSSLFQLMQVTGVKRISESYKIGRESTNIFLSVSDMNKDIRICMLSDDDFSEEECEDLCRRMKEGLLRRPTIAEFDQKANSLHKDITNHWIDREILVLQKLIDRANEKGWRRELYEYINRREQLQTPSMRELLLKELPQVIADAETGLEPTSNPPADHKRENKGNGASPDEILEGIKAPPHLNPEKQENEDAGTEVEPSSNDLLEHKRESKDDGTSPGRVSEGKEISSRPMLRSSPAAKSELLVTELAGGCGDLDNS